MLKTLAVGLIFSCIFPLPAVYCQNATRQSNKASDTLKPSLDLEARRKSLRELLIQQWEYYLSHNPEVASILGDKRWNDRLFDFSQESIDADLRKTKEFLSRFEAIDTTGFPEQEALNKVIIIRQLNETLDTARFKGWEMPETQISGIHLDLPVIISSFPFTNSKDYDDFISRMKQVPRLLDQTTTQMRKGMIDGLMPPRFLLEKVSTQAQAVADQAPEQSPFAQPLSKFPKEVSGAEQARIREQLLSTIRDFVLPAYAKFARFVKEEYAPRGRTEPGMWALPDGAARYAASVKSVTTTDLTTEQIHQIGLSQVAEIEGQLLALARKLGFNDIKSLNASIEQNPKLRATSREQILGLFRTYIDGMGP